MQNIKAIYVYFLSGVLFLVCAGTFYFTEDRNLTPAFASIGCSIITISLVLYSRYQKRKKHQS
ncbi:hypothetical protein [Alteromonas gilva]|uniref:Uncharacterized protein n=1 Tax=Alteromonas gilva TaxID=2987522 RepID=A0ABT5KZW7_9ALTE|nr:hypothetical protein [Alteromonas gilva]MDC8829734.1 hypothetical protein [Alteromonas gilva]